ncbi:MAG: DUF4838 domain-containing protein [Lentisphaerae bacterium]|nr:DUF4838 domain-containing protein [Lentisphaerota bacterium]
MRKICLRLGAAMILARGTMTLASTNGVTWADVCAWELVVSADAIPSEQFAAVEFRDHVEEATGYRLPLVAQPSGTNGQICIGPGAAMRACPEGDRGRGFESDDLRILVRDRVIIIDGGRPRGTLYGVYTFLEDELGVRFLTADHTHVPHVDPARVLEPVDRFYHPPLRFRRSYYAEAERDDVFAARLRNHSESMRDPQVGGPPSIRLINHSFGRLLPTAVYGRQHPEYYGFVDGARRIDVGEDWGGAGNQPCLTNPDVLRIVTAEVLGELRDHPHARNVSVSQNDNPYYCRCPACAALDAQHGGPMGSLLTFVNAVAARVGRDNPDVWVGTLAYDYSRQPPRNLRPDPHVQIQLCSSSACILHALASATCPQNADFVRNFADWGRLCDKVTIWNYNVNFADYLLPCPNLRTIEPNIRMEVAGGAQGVMMQGVYNGYGAEFAELRHYVTSRLLWDPALSGDRLIDEFLDLHYGAAAPQIRRFIVFAQDHVAQAGVHHGFAGGAADYGIDAAVARAGLAAFEDALALAGDDAVLRARVEKASVCAYRAALEPVWGRRVPLLIDDAERREMRELAQRFFALCAAHGVTMASEQQSIEAKRARLGWVLGADLGASVLR